MFRYRLLAMLPFDSTRKRASVILRLPEGSIILLCKGADSSIFSVLASGAETDARVETQDHLNMFACDGLRTLSFAYRVLSEAQYEAWAAGHLQASMAIQDRGDKLMAVYNEIERDLTLIGATGIEDKLQDGVPETIASLREANIKIWVLTGDKQETAIEIAHTCKLVTPSMQLLLLNSAAASKPFDKNSPAEKSAHDKAAEDDVAMLLAQMASPM